MIKTLDSKTKNFDTVLDKLLSKRKNKTQLKSVSVLRLLKMLKEMEIKQY